jgi:hypothetical protein
MMTDKQIEEMVKAIIDAVDYDLAKQLDVQTAEDPETVDAEVARLVAVARKHMPAARGERKRRAVSERSTKR